MCTWGAFWYIFNSKKMFLGPSVINTNDYMDYCLDITHENFVTN